MNEWSGGHKIKKKKQSKFNRGREEIKNKKNSCFLSVTK